MRVNFNAPAAFSVHSQNRASQTLQKTLEKLSTGLRINRAADDAAGLSVSEELRTQVRGTHQAKRNMEDGISLFQILEGTMNEAQNMLQRLRELSVQASNDTLTATERTYLNGEADAIITEIDRIARVHNYLDSFPLDGTFAEVTRTTNTANEAISSSGAVSITDPSAFEEYIGKEIMVEVIQTALAQELEDDSRRSSHVQESRTGQVDHIADSNSETGTSSGTVNDRTATFSKSATDTLDSITSIVRNHDGAAVTGGYTIDSVSSTSVQITMNTDINGAVYDDTFNGNTNAVSGEATIADTDVYDVLAVTDSIQGAVNEFTGNAADNGTLVYTWAGAGSSTLVVGLQTDPLTVDTSAMGARDITVTYQGWEDSYTLNFDSYNKFQLTGPGVIAFAEDLYSGTDVPGENKLEIRNNGVLDGNYTFYDTLDGNNNVVVFDTAPGAGDALTFDYATATGTAVDWGSAATLGETTWTGDNAISANEASTNDGIFNDFFGSQTDNSITISQANRNVSMTLSLDPSWTPTDFVNAFNQQAEQDDLEAEAYIDGGTGEVRLRPGTSGWKTRDEGWAGEYFELSGFLNPNGDNFGPGSTGDTPLTDQNIFMANETQAAVNSQVRVTLVEDGTILEDSTSTWNRHTLGIGISVDILSTADVGDSSTFVVASSTLQIGANNTEADTMDFTLPNITAESLGIDTVNLNSHSQALTSIGLVDTALDTITSNRVFFGSLINRGNHVVNNLATQEFNLAASESGIRDADIAQEATEFARKNILLNASQTILAQANAQSQSVLQLLNSI